MMPAEKLVVTPPVKSPAALLRRSGVDLMVHQAHSKGRHLSWETVQRFAERGVSALALQAPWPVRRDDVVFRGKTFVFSRDCGEQGEAAFTIAVITNQGLREIVAWDPITSRIATWRGEGFALGEGQLDRFNFGSLGVPIFKSPMTWLARDRRGIVVLRQDIICNRLGMQRALVAENDEHQHELQEALRMQSAASGLGAIRLPVVRVRSQK
jgi:hypothetical protein